MPEVISSLIGTTPGRRLSTFILEQLAQTSNAVATASSSTSCHFFQHYTPAAITVASLYNLFFSDDLKKASNLSSVDKKEIVLIIEKCSKWNGSSYCSSISLKEVLSKTFDNLTEEEAESIANAFIQSKSKLQKAGKTLVIAGFSCINPFLGMVAHLASHALTEAATLSITPDYHDHLEIIRNRY